MDINDFVLAALAPANREPHSPVQVQKLLFVLQEEIPGSIGGKHFEFEPYDYGPFDASVYRVLENLSEKNLVEIIPGWWNSFRLTADGQERGNKLLEEMEEPIKEYFKRLSRFVLSLSFSQLVSSIYKAYPNMKENSVFQD